LTEMREKSDPLVELQYELERTQNDVKKAAKRLDALKSKTIEDLGCPKPPPSSYMLFAATIPRETRSATEQAKFTGNQWKLLPEAKKQVYAEKSKYLREKYTKDLSNWKKKVAGENPQLFSDLGIKEDVVEEKKPKPKKLSAAKKSKLAKSSKVSLSKKPTERKPNTGRTQV